LSAGRGLPVTKLIIQKVKYSSFPLMQSALNLSYEFNSDIKLPRWNWLVHHNECH